MAERLYRSRDDRMLAGVAGGVAEILDADPSIVRIVWAMLAIFTGGVAILVYVVMAVVVPEAPAGWSAPPAGAPAPAGAQTADAPTSSWATERDARRAARRAHRAASGDSARAGFVAGIALVVIGTFFLIREIVPWFEWSLWWPIGLILLGGLLLVVALLPGRSSG